MDCPGRPLLAETEMGSTQRQKVNRPGGEGGTRSDLLAGGHLESKDNKMALEGKWDREHKCARERCIWRDSRGLWWLGG